MIEEALAMSTIDSQLTDRERLVLARYRDPAMSGMGRAVRLSVQYAVGGAVFLYLAIVTNNPLWSAAIYLIFLAWLGIRLLGGWRLSGVMPSIIAKYERRIEELERRLDKADPI